MSGNKTRASVMRKFTGLIPPGSEEKLAADVGRIKHILQGGTFSCPSPRDTHTRTLGCRSLAKAPKTHPFWCQPSTQLKPPHIWEYPHGPPAVCMPSCVSGFVLFPVLPRFAEDSRAHSHRVRPPLAPVFYRISFQLSPSDNGHQRHNRVMAQDPQGL